MIHMSRGTVLTVLCVVGWIGAAEAQSPNRTRPTLQPFQRPTTSPYLNLLGPGGPAYQYYQNVIPQQDFQRSQQQFRESVYNMQKGISQNQRQIMDLNTIGPTGHRAGFMNQGSYFSTSGSGGSGGGRMSAPSRVIQPLPSMGAAFSGMPSMPGMPAGR